MARLLLLLLASASCVLALRRHAKKVASGGSSLLTPQWKGGKAVGLVMIPGGFVNYTKYEEPMRRWQDEAEKAGISLWVVVKGFWAALPLPIRTVANVKNYIEVMKANGLPKDAPVYYSGHSMGAGANLPPIDTLYREGVIAGAVLQAAYVLHEYMPPMAESWNWPTPTLTIGGDMNFGSSRITRMAEAVYNQPDSHPVVVIEGMNHMQFASNFKKADLKPYISEAEGQRRVGQVSVDWIAKELGLSAGEWLRSETQRTKALVAPIIAAYEYEGSRMFNVPNQFGTPNVNCPGGVCPDGSRFITEAQEHIATSEVTKTMAVRSIFVDLSGTSSLKIRPSIQDNSIQALTMTAGKEDFFTKDFNEPHHPGEMSAKFISRQAALQTVRKLNAPADADLCKELNQKAYAYALKTAGLAAQRRFNTSGQELVFDDTVYRSTGLTFTANSLKWEERSGRMHVQAQGLFREPRDEVVGRHYCKLLSPARAMEWIYVDGLKAKLFGKW